jgi:hypothetical protein
MSPDAQDFTFFLSKPDRKFREGIEAVDGTRSR